PIFHQRQRRVPHRRPLGAGAADGRGRAAPLRGGVPFPGGVRTAGETAVGAGGAGGAAGPRRPHQRRARPRGGLSGHLVATNGTLTAASKDGQNSSSPAVKAVHSLGEKQRTV